jgi:general secretion pathway protein J
MKRTVPAAGFTLLELLVAIAIFAIVAAMALTGYTQLQRQSEYADQRLERTRELQRAVQVISQDVEQLEPRPIREPLGEGLVPAVTSGTGVDYALEFSRAGWSNTAGLQRPTIERVGYRVENDELWRDHWPVLDRTIATEPVRLKLLTHVKTLSLRFMDGGRNWSDRWPESQTAGPSDDRLRPIAVEVTIELDDFGKIRRVLEVPG